jgi:hypothetical protein
LGLTSKMLPSSGTPAGPGISLGMMEIGVGEYR